MPHVPHSTAGIMLTPPAIKKIMAALLRMKDNTAYTEPDEQQLQTLYNGMIDRCCERLQTAEVLNDELFENLVTRIENEALCTLYQCKNPDELDSYINNARKGYSKSHHCKFLEKHHLPYFHADGLQNSAAKTLKKKTDETFRNYMKREHHDTDGHRADAEIAQANKIYNATCINDLTDRMLETYRKTMQNLIVPNQLWN